MENVNINAFIEYCLEFIVKTEETMLTQKAIFDRFAAFVKTMAVALGVDCDKPSSNAPSVDLLQTTGGCDVKFTEKELMSMPKTFRKEFRVDGSVAHVRKKQNSKNSYSYEIRYRRNGYNVCVSAVSLEKAKEKFIAALKSARPVGLDEKKVPTDFNGFVEYFFTDYYAERVAKETLYNMRNTYKNWMRGLGGMQLKDITPGMCKQLLQSIKAQGKGKTADTVYSIFNQTFKLAMAYNLLDKNPVAVVPYKQHERQNGKRLTVAEEEKLLSECDPRLQKAFATYLYTGIRPGEIYTVRREGPFIIAQNFKQKGQKFQEKKIPLIDKLLPYWNEPLGRLPKIETIRAEFARILPGHTLKDCRRTFNSHCEECGVKKSVSEKWLGHAPQNKLDCAYTEFSDEFMLAEAAKLKW